MTHITCLRTSSAKRACLVALAFALVAAPASSQDTPAERTAALGVAMGGVVTERGFRPEVRINGPLAMVWYPYDLYRDGRWSHCGVDVFTLIRNEGRWRIATMSWSAEQPPACEPHPDGPVKR
jgi:hypothetical protein